jgi:hypothetical protein
MLQTRLNVQLPLSVPLVFGNIKVVNSSAISWQCNLTTRFTLFWVITQHILVIPYRRFGPTFWSHLQRSRITTICCTLTQRKADLIYFAPEASIHAI